MSAKATLIGVSLCDFITYMLVIGYFMNYEEHRQSIKEKFHELDLLKESEFHLFKNQSFALKCATLCMNLCNQASKKLEIDLHFSFQYNLMFNAQAIIKNNFGVILINVGLIDQLETLVSDSMEIFSTESVANLTILETDKVEFKEVISELCLFYLFYHELAHIIQLSKFNSATYLNYQEQYSNSQFDLKNHVYELDADHFGATMSAYKLLEYARKKNYPIETLLLLNLLTGLLFSIGNIIIGFTDQNFKNIYYKQHSHPHPLIRIIECNEQILTFVSKNFAIENEFFLATLSRTITMFGQLDYKGKEKINYSKLTKDNSSEIEKYIDEIELANNLYDEIIRHNVQKIFNLLSD